MPDQRVLPALDKDGNPLSGDALARAVQSGEVYAPAGGAVGMVTKTGERRVVPAAELQKALHAGYVPEGADIQQRAAVEEKRGTFGQQLLAAGESAIETGLPIVGRALLDATSSKETLQAERERREVNPTASTIGGVVGLGAAIGLSGGTSMFSRVASAPVRGLVLAPGRAAAGLAARGLTALGVEGKLATVATGVARAVGEGAALGAIEKATEVEREPTPWDAEDMAHAAFSGALSGAMWGGAAELGLSAAGVAGRKLFGGGRSVGQWSEEVANEAALRSIGLMPSDWNKLGGRDRYLQLGKMLRTAEVDGEKVLGTFSRSESLAEPIAKAKNAVSARFNDMVKRTLAEADQLGIEPNLAPFVDKVKAIVQPLQDSLVGGANEEARSILSQVGKILERHEASTIGKVVPHVATAEERALAKQAEKELGGFTKVLREDAEELGETLAESYPRFEKLLAEKLKSARVTIPAQVDLRAFGKTLQKHPKEMGQLLQDDFESFLATAGDRVGSVERFDRVLEPALKMEEVLAIKRQLADEVYKETRKGMGIAGPPSPAVENLRQIERALNDTIADAGERTLRQTGRDPADWRAAHQEMSRWIDLEKLSEKAAMRHAGHVSFGLQASLGGVAAAAGGLGAPGALFGALSTKVVRERGNSMLARGAGHLSSLVNSNNARMQQAATSLALGTGAARQTLPLLTTYAGTASEPKEGALTDENVLASIEQLRKLQGTSFDERSGLILAALGPAVETQPKLAAEAARVMMLKVQYLQNQLPNQLTVRPPLGGASRQAPQVISSADLARFKSRLRGVTDPVGVIERLAKKEVEPGAIEAVKVTAPELWRTAQSMVLDQVETRKTPLPHDDARFLGAVFGFDAVSEQNAKNVQRAQIALAMQLVQPENIPKPPEMASQGQKLESGNV